MANNKKSGKAKEAKVMTAPKTPIRKGLGKGIGALLETSNDIQIEDNLESVLQIDINDISPMEGQPRQSFDDEKLAELADSIKENGIIQPIIVRKRSQGDYVLIAGERRWRAARLAGLKEVPALVREVGDEEQLRQALIENIQREDLNPMEEAQAFQRLMEEHGMTQEVLAKALGKSRSAVANTLRLNRLPVEIRDFIQRGELSEGHARALLALPDSAAQIQAADYVLTKGLNVRQCEQYIRALLTRESRTEETPVRDEQYELSIRDVEDRLRKSLGTKVVLKDRAGKGQIRIPYSGLDELDRLLELLGGK